MKRILFKFASRGRLEKLRNCLSNINDKLSDENHLVWLTEDEDDKTYHETLMYSFIGETIKIERGLGVSDGKIDAINRDMHFASSAIQWDILINMSDDMEFLVDGFDDIIRKDMPEDLDCLLHYPDGNINKLVTMSIMGRKYYDRFNYIYHPDYYSLWCDNEQTVVAQMLGKYKYVDRQIFSHNHPAYGKAPTDDQYKRTESYYHQDEAVFLRRKAINFDLPEEYTLPLFYPNSKTPV